MGEPMALRDEDIGRIEDYVKPCLRGVVEDLIPGGEPAGVGVQLLERMVWVEEELKAQRQLMDERFGFMERRFEAVDKRFEVMLGHADSRFAEHVGHTNTRSADLIAQMNTRFADLTIQMNARFSELTWMIGVGFVITALTTLYALLA